MNLIPFGEVLQDRVDLSKKYKLIEVVNGFWRLTQKCKDNYEATSYFYYLQGKIEKPVRISKGKTVEKTVQEQMRSPEVQKVISEILNL